MQTDRYLESSTYYGRSLPIQQLEQPNGEPTSGSVIGGSNTPFTSATSSATASNKPLVLNFGLSGIEGRYADRGNRELAASFFSNQTGQNHSSFSGLLAIERSDKEVGSNSSSLNKLNVQEVPDIRRADVKNGEEKNSVQKQDRMGTTGTAPNESDNEVVDITGKKTAKPEIGEPKEGSGDERIDDGQITGDSIEKPSEESLEQYVQNLTMESMPDLIAPIEPPSLVETFEASAPDDQLEELTAEFMVNPVYAQPYAISEKQTDMIMSSLKKQTDSFIEGAENSGSIYEQSLEIK